MNINKLIELLLNFLFKLVNLVVSITHFNKFFKTNKKIKKLQNLHKDKKIFILLNGASLNSYDLSFLKNEIVICANHFDKSENYSIVEPNYHCATDNNYFDVKKFPNRKQELEDLLNNNDKVRFIFNQKYNKYFSKRENVYSCYTKHIPCKNDIKLDFSRRVSSFSNIYLYAIAFAMYLGSREIYLLGLDFEPGVFSHFYKESSKDSIVNRNNKDEVFGWYLGYTRAHLESYYLNELAKKKNTKVFNLNSNSYIRAFDFKEYKDIF